MSPMMAVDLGLSFSSPSFSLLESSAPLVSSQRTSRTINLSNPSSLSRNSSSRVTCQISTSTETTTFLNKNTYSLKSKKIFSNIPRSSGSSSSEASEDGMKASNDKNKTPFGYSRKDVLLIGLGVTLVGIGLESGLEFVGVDPLKAGNAVQLVMVLGLTVGWISTYIFRVSNKDMTYAQQLRDYEYKVMEKRLEGLTEAEVQVLMEQVEEEKRSLASSEQVQ